MQFLESSLSTPDRKVSLEGVEDSTLRAAGDTTPPYHFSPDGTEQAIAGCSVLRFDEQGWMKILDLMKHVNVLGVWLVARS